MERVVGEYSGMVVRARRGATITAADSERIIIDNADEYELRKFVGLNERTCQNQKTIVKVGQTVKTGEIIADGASTEAGELAIGKNVLVAFNTFDGYNFEDAIVISERLVKEDVFTSIHIESFDVEIRETKLGKDQVKGYPKSAMAGSFFDSREETFRETDAPKELFAGECEENA